MTLGVEGLLLQGIPIHPRLSSWYVLTLVPGQYRNCSLVSLVVTLVNDPPEKHSD